MKTIILAGGHGTRLSEETYKIPKPMVEIGNYPILWHIMKIYSYYGFNDFIICCGYKGHIIREFFYNYYNNHSDITLDMENNLIEYHKSAKENWKITLVDTGYETLTANRILKIKDYIPENESFFLTYGDGLSNINIDELLKFHNEHSKVATVTAVPSPGRFGSIKIDSNNTVNDFEEKPNDEFYINGGFFVLNYGIFDYIPINKETMLEQGTLKNLTQRGELKSFYHRGFWKAMDTLKDKGDLEKMWNSNEADWKVW